LVGWGEGAISVPCPFGRGTSFVSLVHATNAAPAVEARATYDTRCVVDGIAYGKAPAARSNRARAPNATAVPTPARANAARVQLAIGPIDAILAPALVGCTDGGCLFSGTSGMD
jgi:hypothetical protein